MNFLILNKVVSVVKSNVIQSESEESRVHKVGVPEILPPYGRLNDSLALTNISIPTKNNFLSSFVRKTKRFYVLLHRLFMKHP